MSSSGSSSNSISRISDKLLENMVPQCVKKKSQKCRRPALQRNVISRDEIPLENTAAELGHFGGFRAVHYRLNITINRDMHTSYEGSVEIMLRAVENTSTVFVHVGRPIAGIDLAQIELWNCFNGNILCVSSMVQHLHHELLSIDLTESILIGQLIVLRVSNFGSPHADNGFVVQNPHKWEPKRFEIPNLLNN
ncbi:unnamed protein product [Toxocara canis]|uniref:PPC domain-containing protein n=1 Tax=Toxocara canis TaxID=6265 RepID=A0A183VE65_TOXCA|nr:unnamed protein product [Toxocara canis]